MLHYSEYTDDSLLRLLKEGDENAFTAIYYRYWDVLYKSVFNVLHDDAFCLDILHDLFVWLWNHREQLEIISLKSYLRTAVKFKMLNVIRKEKIRQNAIEQYNKTNHLQLSNEDLLEAKELQHIVDIFINKLPKQAGKIFLLSRKEQLTNKEIADRLHLSESTVKKQINISLKKLRIVLYRHIPLWIYLSLLFKKS